MIVTGSRTITGPNGTSLSAAPSPRMALGEQLAGPSTSRIVALHVARPSSDDPRLIPGGNVNFILVTGDGTRPVRVAILKCILIVVPAPFDEGGVKATLSFTV